MASGPRSFGIVRVNQGKLEDAIAAFRKAAALTPNVAQVHNNLGSALVAQGKHGEAVASYRKAIALNPKYAEAHFNAGYALKCQGKLTDAVIHYRNAISLKPGYAGARNNLGTAPGYRVAPSCDAMRRCHEQLGKPPLESHSAGVSGVRPVASG